MTCVSLTACRRERHPLASCTVCRVLTCRYALDVDGACWRCEAVPAWAPVLVRGQPRNVWGTAWLDVAARGEVMPRPLARTRPTPHRGAQAPQGARR